MIERSKYRKLRKAVATQIKEQLDRDFIAINKKFFITPEIAKHEVNAAWPYVARELGLVDDGTGCDTWTIPGRGIFPLRDEAFFR